MKVLLDSSTIIAAMLSDHIHHALALPWLSRAKAGAFEFVVSGHSIAEVYSVLTRLPRTPKISSGEAWELLRDNVTSCASIITLSGSEYVALVEGLAHGGISGGAVYDAVIASAVESASVDLLVTLNEGHFLRVWPAGASRIVSRVSAAPPA
jgi:predicted nucleic acid-binding protein